jgi:hypothetical protein
MRIAVVGAGISGLGAALALSRSHEVWLIEKAQRFGGHANTVTVDHGGTEIAVDTGFIVYNEANYPNLSALFRHLDVPTHWSDMSFGFSLGNGAMEYACDSVDKLFAQRRNLLNPRFIAGVRDILRFNGTAPGELDAGALDGLSLGEWLERKGFSAWFRDCFLLPMGGAIWSTPAGRILDFPARGFVAFFRNHDLMTGLAPARRWRTVTGGSRAYVERLIRALGPRARARAGLGAAAVGRQGGRPVVRFADGSEAAFDQVVLATHAPEALRLIAAPGPEERAILGAFRTTPNRAILHADAALMPRRRRVWSSWNFLSEGAARDAASPPAVTYWMNRLQGLPARHPLFVSLNPRREPDPALVFGSFAYDHPAYDAAAFAAQEALDAIQGRGGIWYAGAWTGYGFHEDGLRAGLRVAAALGARPDWAVDIGAPMATPLARAAE